MADIPIPARCAGRPTSAGLVIPTVSVMLGDGRPVFGAVHRSKALRCIAANRCQICGQLLGRPIVVLCSDQALAQQYSTEAALHPECAAYSRQACPMLSGRMATHHAPDRHIGQSCPEPGCDCGGWVDTDTDVPSGRGRPVGLWWAVWLPGYAIAVDVDGQPHGLTWQGIQPLRIRPIPATHARETHDDAA